MFLILTFILLTGCGKSDKEINDIAAVTCSIITESKMVESSFRIKEVNDAREKMDLDPYLDGDDGIREAISYGLCIELVKDDPNYEKDLFVIKSEIRKLAEERKRESDRLAAEKKEEEERLAAERWKVYERLAAERKKEADRLAAEKKKEKDRLAAERKKEKDRLAAEEKKEAERIASIRPTSMKAWRNNLVTESKQFEPELIKVELLSNRLAIYITCQKNNILKGQLVTSFKGTNNYISKIDYPNYCNTQNINNTSLHYIFLSKLPQQLKYDLSRSGRLKSLIDDMYISINATTHINDFIKTNKDKMLHPSNHLGLNSNDRLIEPIIIPIKI